MLGSPNEQRTSEPRPEPSQLHAEEATERTPLVKNISLAPTQQTASRDDVSSSGSSSELRSHTSGSPPPAFPEESPLDHRTSKGITRRLYLSHFLSTWNSRGFEFGAILFLAAIYPGTLLPMSIYALVRAASAIFIAPSIGQYIDSGNRLKVVRSSIVWQRGAVALSCVLFWISVLKREDLPAWSTAILLGANIFLACIERLSSMMNTVSVERDWVVVIADGKEDVLRQMNSQMRRIDLFCKLVSPLFIALLDGISTDVAILVTFGINSICLVVEYALIARVYKVVPGLSQPRAVSRVESDDAANTQETRSAAQQTTSLVKNMRMYVSQEAFLPSLSLSILYLTVLAFSGQMVTYLLAVGYTPSTIGLLRVGSTVCEISATWLTPWTMRRIGPIMTGFWFLSFQMACLGIAVVIFWTAKAPIWAASGLVGGTALSRIGLRGFDLAAQVIIQEEVEPQNRGAFSTTEAALQNFFELCAYASTMVFPRPADFKYPAAISILAVYIAGASYTKFVRDSRGHVSRCMKPGERPPTINQEGAGDLAMS